ncbi:leucine-rich repeat-containing protein 75A isoform X1 [Anas platyrhynchos]|uniref:leucine-rich repeat-containing protein 75A isoform X1 n=2 Tax=Anas platyrhynchos TaxID=8839 RepID=UPI003AF22739
MAQLKPMMENEFKVNRENFIRCPEETHCALCKINPPISAWEHTEIAASYKVRCKGQHEWLAKREVSPGCRLPETAASPSWQWEVLPVADLSPKDLGMESTSLDDVLYRYASFRNLVDPITHDLIISLARYIHCPKPEGDSLGAMEKLCRQLTYHLSPHSQWRRQGIMKRKPQSCLKAVLMGKPQDNTVDLSGIPLTLKDLERIASYLQHSSEHIDTVELCFTELTDEMLLQLLPALCVLPHLTTLSLNGNRLTKAILRDLTETLKDPKKFPSVTWIDLGNNVDIFSLPQPFLVSLKRRCPKQGNLPTILEFGEGQVSDLESQDGRAESQEDLRVDEGDKTRAGTTDSMGSQQTDRTVEAGALPGSEQGAATAQT